LKMVIFHSYVSLPEGNFIDRHLVGVTNIYQATLSWGAWGVLPVLMVIF
jgi:hypothetical protein